MAAAAPGTGEILTHFPALPSPIKSNFPCALQVIYPKSLHLNRLDARDQSISFVLTNWRDEAIGAASRIREECLAFIKQVEQDGDFSPLILMHQRFSR